MMNRGSESESVYNIVRKYTQLLESGIINISELPPCIKNTNSGTELIFINSLFDHKHVKCILPTECKNLFRSQDFPLIACKIEDQELQKEAQYMSYIRTNDFYMHTVVFILDPDMNLIGEYMIDGKHIKETAGKTLRKLPWIYKKSDAQIEQMVNMIKAYYVPDLTFSIVKGDAIKEWYHESKYKNKSGSLSNSCMRYTSCQKYLDIYCENDCQMLIATDSEGKLHGRALLWPRSMWNKNYYSDTDIIMDRIYGTEVTIKRFIMHAQNKGWVHKKTQNFTDNQNFMFKGEDGVYTTEHKRMRMNLTTYNFDYYPYVDTFNTMSYDTESIKNHGEGDMLTETGGGTSEANVIECYDCGNSVNDDDVRWVNDERYCDDCVNYSEYDDQDYRSDEVTYSEVLNSYIWHEDAYEITHGTRSGEFTHIDETVQCYLDEESFVAVNDIISNQGTPVPYLTSDDTVQLSITTIDDIINEANTGVIRINSDTIPYMPSNTEAFTRNRGQYMANYNYEYKTSNDAITNNIMMDCSTNENYDAYCWAKVYRYIHAIWCKYGIESINVNWDGAIHQINFDATTYNQYKDLIVSGELRITDANNANDFADMFETSMEPFMEVMCAITSEFPLNHRNINENA